MHPTWLRLEVVDVAINRCLTNYAQLAAKYILRQRLSITAPPVLSNAPDSFYLPLHEQCSGRLTPISRRPTRRRCIIRCPNTSLPSLNSVHLLRRNLNHNRNSRTMAILSKAAKQEVRVDTHTQHLEASSTIARRKWDSKWARAR